MSSERTTVPKMGCGYVVCAVLALGGAGLLALASERWHQRRTTDAWISGSIGLALCVASVGLIRPMQREVARAQERRRREDAKPAEPWTWNEVWTQRGGIRQPPKPWSTG